MAILSDFKVKIIYPRNWEPFIEFMRLCKSVDAGKINNADAFKKYRVYIKTAKIKLEE